MNTLACLIVIFILYSYLVSRVLVRFFPNQLNKIKYKWPLGFFIILSLIQLVSFPLQHTHVSISAVTWVYHFIFICLTALIVIELYLTVRSNRKAIRRFELSQLKDYVLIIGFIIFNFFICYNTDSFNDIVADQSFYITFVEHNLNASQINTILPLSGIVSKLSELYNFQGFYLFLTYLGSLFKVESVLIMAWFVPFMLWITVAMTFLNLIHYFKLSSKWYLSIGTFLMLWTFTDLFDYFVRYNGYGNNIRVFVFVYLMIFYCEYFKQPKVKTLILCALLWLSAISLQSTALFLGIFLMVSYGIYDLFFTKKRLIVPLIFSATLILLYAAFFLGERSSWMPAYLFSGVLFFLVGCSFFNRTRILLNQLIYNRVMQVGVILGVILMMLLSIRMMSSLNINNSVSPTQMLQYLMERYEFQENCLIPYKNYCSILLIAFRRILLFVNLYVLLHFKELNSRFKFIIGTQVIIILVFYNPIVCGFISTYLTGIVYTRIEDIVLSLFVMTSLMLYASRSRYLKYLVVILSLISTVYLGLKTRNYLNNPDNQINNIETYNHLYRLDQSLIDTAVTLADYIDENMDGERPKVLTLFQQVNYFTSSYEMVYTVEHQRRLSDEAYRKQYQDIYLLRDVLLSSSEVNQEVKEQFIPIVYDNEIDFIITSTDIDTWLKQALEENGECIFQNTEYFIYKINY